MKPSRLNSLVFSRYQSGMIDALKNQEIQPHSVVYSSDTTPRGVQMFNNRIIVALAAVLVIILGIQAYMIFQLNDRLKQFTGQENLVGSPQLKYQSYPIYLFPSRVLITSTIRITHGILMKKCSECKMKWNNFSAIHFPVFI